MATPKGSDLVTSRLATLDADGSHAAHVLQEPIDGQLTSHEAGGSPQVEVVLTWRIL